MSDIAFNTIPISIRVPGQYIEFNNSQANSGLPAMPSTILVIGQKLPSGQVASGTPLQIFTPSQAGKAFGRGSMIANMLAALYNANSVTAVWAIAQDDNPAGAPAAGSILFGGAPTAAGTFTLYVGANNVPGGNTSVQIAISAGMTPAAMAAELVAAIAADLDLPVTAAVDGANTAKVNLTCVHKGTFGNSLDLRTTYYAGDAFPVGMTCTITPMSGGTADPDLTDTIIAMADVWYNSIAFPYSSGASIAEMQAELVRREGALVQIPGHAYGAVSGSLGTVSAFGITPNSKYFNFFDAGLSPTHPSIWAAVTAGIIEYYGNIDQAQPLQTLALPGILSPDVSDRRDWQERNLLLQDGIATTKVDAGGNVLIERAITAYITNPEGYPDTSYLDVETLLTLYYLRFSVQQRIAEKFPRFKLAADGTLFGAGEPVVTPSIIKTELLALFTEWEEAALAQNLTAFKAALNVQLDQTDPDRVDALIPPQLVTGFRVFAAQIQFAL
jgi:phage tail sheath gpL-like